MVQKVIQERGQVTLVTILKVIPERGPVIFNGSHKVLKVSSGVKREVTILGRSGHI